MMDALRYAFPRLPAVGETIEVRPGVLWLRMPLPFRLDHINLWLLDDGETWTAVDCGIGRDEVRGAWERIGACHLGGRPVGRVIVTHFHPDHVGLAGWFARRYGAELWMTVGEWAVGRMLALDTGDAALATLRRFYRAAGFPADRMALVDERSGRYASMIEPIPGHYRRLIDGETIAIGPHRWRVIVGRGHSPEHACLHCPDLGVLISGDQILPRITTNLSVWPQEPSGDPLRLYLESLERFRDLPADVLVLPSHDAPFVGLPSRLAALAHHHDARLLGTLAACAEPRTGFEVLARLFKRDLDDHELFFAVGESLAHLHYLVGQGRMVRLTDGDGVNRFRAAAEPARP